MLWLELEDHSFVNLERACRAYDQAGRLVVVLGDHPGFDLHLEGKDARRARKALHLEAVEAALRESSWE